MNNHSQLNVAGFAPTILALSEGGQVYLPVAELPLISFVHLISGMDEDTPQVSGAAAVATHLPGYTERVTAGNPVISIKLGLAIDDDCEPYQLETARSAT